MLNTLLMLLGIECITKDVDNCCGSLDILKGRDKLTCFKKKKL